MTLLVNYIITIQSNFNLNAFKKFVTRNFSTTSKMNVLSNLNEKDKFL